MHHTSEQTNETLGTDACNIRVQPLQYMQHLDLLLQYPCVKHISKIFQIYTLKYLKHLKHFKTYQDKAA